MFNIFYVRFTKSGIAVKFALEHEPPKGFVTLVGGDEEQDIVGGINLTAAPIKIGNTVVYDALHISTYDKAHQPKYYAEQHRIRVMLDMPDISVGQMVDMLIRRKQANAYAAEAIFGCKRSTQGHKLLDEGTSSSTWATYVTLYKADNLELLRLVANDHEWKLQPMKPEGDIAIEVFEGEWLVLGKDASAAVWNDRLNVTTP